MFTLFIRGAVLYITMILVMRGLGKRQLGEFQPFELAMTMLVANLISEPMESVSAPLLNGILPVVAMFLVHSLISLLSVRFDRLRAVLSGKPTVVINRGVIDREALDKLCLSLADLLEGLRGAGYLDPTKVGTAIVEANGAITAFPDSRFRGPGLTEMNLPASYEGLPLMLILDGRIQPANLRRSGRDDKWLRTLLSDRGLRPDQVFLASLDTSGQLSVQLKQGGTLKIDALEAGKVAW